jgi:hypothetical protein
MRVEMTFWVSGTTGDGVIPGRSPLETCGMYHPVKTCGTFRTAKSAARFAQLAAVSLISKC